MNPRARPVQPLSRRRFVQGALTGGVLMGMGARPRSAWALATGPHAGLLAGTDFDLTIGETLVDFTGRMRAAATVNGLLPAPTLRWREGTTVNVRVHNALPRGSIHGGQASLHWHGLQLPANMDGVPGLSFDGIQRGESFLYRFKVGQAGTYWYHSHSGLQEQAGIYGALIIDPLQPEPFSFERDYVVLLSDWTDLAPAALLARLKKMPSHDNFHQRTMGDFIHDAGEQGIQSALADRRMWGRMRMNPTDLSDVNGHTYTYLMNGVTSAGNWTALFKPGEKVRLRFINGSAMTYFDVRIPGLKMTVVAADGQYVHPVSVDEFRIAAAETFDVIVEPNGQDAFTIFAQDAACTGHVRGTLAQHEGLQAPVPTLDPRPLLTMLDMGGMQHGAGHHGAVDEHAAHGGHDAHAGHAGTANSMQAHPASESNNPLVDGQAMAPVSRLDDPGNGLRDNGRKVLSYSMLKSAFADPDGRDPGRDIEIHLTGHMEKFAWSFNGRKFADAEPIHMTYGERLRIVLVNDTMMAHPVHLHGLWSDVEDDDGNFLFRKHTVDIPPGSKRSYRVRADALGHWAYHCHMLFHMETGMMQSVHVGEGES